MACQKCGTTITAYQAPTLPTFLALCLNSDRPLANLGGALLPVHRVEIAVTQPQIDAWQSQGFVFQIREAVVS